METSTAALLLDGWVGALVRGAAMSVLIAALAMALGLVIGTCFGLVKWLRVRGFALAVDIYTTLVRGVPELLVIYLFFFASEGVLTHIAAAFGYDGVMAALFPLMIVVLAIGLIAAAYATETLRGALAAIPHGHIEAARALGLGRWRIFRRIILPQMLRIAVPGINNIWQNTIKDTALVSLVAVSELLFRAQVGANSTGRPFLFYGLAVAGYLIITFISQLLFAVAERRFGLRGV